MWDYLETLPVDQADATVILLHGLGSSGDDLIGIVPEIDLPEGIRFVLPHATARPVTVNGGMVMPAWFDILAFTGDSEQDVEGIKRASAELGELIQAEIAAGIPAEQIILMGFSQGGALALYGGLHYPERLAGIIGLSTYLPARDSINMDDIPYAETPVAMAHGSEDDVVLPEWGELSREHLELLGVNVDWQTYPMGHQICWAEVQQVSQWIQRMLG